jgi:tetraacyldisaccharide 4'-kinase
MAGISDTFIKAWYNGAWWLGLLLPLSWLFGLVTRHRRHRYLASVKNAGSSSIPVIVVGNITVGGTGKSPLVAHLVHAFQHMGIKPAVVSRGYGAKIPNDQVRQVKIDSQANEVGDEPMMLRHLVSCPIFVAPKRCLAVAAAQAEGCELVIADDGLQHYAMPRDIEICVLDATRGLGNEHLLPAGPLREPVSRLRTVDFLVWNQQDNHAIPPYHLASDNGYRMHMQALYFSSLDGEQRLSVDDFVARFGSQHTIQAFAAIGNPERFFSSLEGLGLRHIERHAFPDHHAYRKENFSSDDSLIVMTEKDAVKCRQFTLHNAWVLCVEAVLTNALTEKANSDYADKFAVRLYNMLQHSKRLPRSVSGD